AAEPLAAVQFAGFDLGQAGLRIGYQAEEGAAVAGDTEERVRHLRAWNVVTPGRKPHVVHLTVGVLLAEQHPGADDGLRQQFADPAGLDRGEEGTVAERRVAHAA